MDGREEEGERWRTVGEVREKDGGEEGEMAVGCGGRSHGGHGKEDERRRVRGVKRRRVRGGGGG